MILETIFGIIIVLFILGLCFVIIYWCLLSLYKGLNKSTHKEIESLKQRVELLERENINK